ncbi:MAG: cytochrome c family protein [Parvibaculum sp.]|uniref:c-type cytochrome n=1 Tax=Parvibaculum sp. TaxID=2024848 RepID=UPI002840AADC|nr:cytochrome c family protein [Parvibaculum sp.]MDR3497980.1 cytochrome c family protein [Parvibaculum sp.]
MSRTASLLAATAFAVFAAGPAGAFDKGDAARGKALYAQCRSCHMPQANSVGPKHCGVVGRKAATVAGYTYSPAMRKSGLTWTPDTLDRFLTAPARTVPGNFMPFAGLSKPQERADIIAYLATLTCP